MSKVIITNENEFKSVAEKVALAMANEMTVDRESEYGLIKLLAVYSCALCKALENESEVDEHEK
jgi:hypothetical protein